MTSLEKFGPKYPWAIRMAREDAARAAKVFAEFGYEVCETCNGDRYAEIDGVYTTCWRCNGSGARTFYARS